LALRASGRIDAGPREAAVRGGPRAGGEGGRGPRSRGARRVRREDRPRRDRPRAARPWRDPLTVARPRRQPRVLPLPPPARGRERGGGVTSFRPTGSVAVVYHPSVRGAREVAERLGQQAYDRGLAVRVE